MTEVDWIGLAGILLQLVLALIVAIFVSANRKPESAIAWMMAVVFVPLVGIVLFALIGAQRLPRSRRDKQRYVSELIMARTEGGLGRSSRCDQWPEWLPSVVRMNETLGALPMVGGNSTVLIEDYRAAIKAVADDVDHATRTVHVEFFILVYDDFTAPLFEALQRACARGVEVRVLSDHAAQFSYPARSRTRRMLAEMGASYEPMLPLRPFHGRWRRPDLRNHRKLVTIDGTIAHTGSLNMIADHYHKRKGIKRGLHWHELMIRLEGPIVRELDAVFVTDWYSETDELLPLDYSPVRLDDPAGVRDAQVIPSGPTFDNDNNLKLFAAVIHNAKRRVSITSPYFVPDSTIQLAMMTAAARGLDIELFVSATSDQFMVYHAQRSYYEQLLRAGVKIYLYTEPTILHAKHLSIDEDVAIIGSSNLDIRSLSLHMELMVLIHGTDVVDELRAVQDGYRAASRQLTLEGWLARPRREKLLDNVMRLTSSLM